MLNLVGGGFMGAMMSLQAILTAKELGRGALAIYVFAAVVYAAFACVGLRVAESYRPNALLVGCFLLQTPFLLSPFLTYQFSAGCFVLVGLANEELFWSARAGAHWQFSLLHGRNFGIGLNLLALVATIVEGRRYLHLLDARDDGEMASAQHFTDSAAGSLRPETLLTDAPAPVRPTMTPPAEHPLPMEVRTETPPAPVLHVEPSPTGTQPTEMTNSPTAEAQPRL